MKKPYLKPTILKLGSPLYAKHGSVSRHSLPIRKAIDGVSINSLCRDFGSPLFVFSEASIREAIQTARQEFTSRYPKVTFGWSYKTNYLKAICSIFHQEGAIAEVVSDFEYEKARGLGIPGNQIIFNGPCKPNDALKRAILEGAQIHIDSLDEISAIEKIASSLKKKVAVGLRVNMNTGTHPQWSRFGLNLENGQAMDAVKRICMSDSLTLAGFHCHIGTFMLNTNAYQVAAEKMAKLYKEVQSNFRIKLKFLDLGGGFASRNRLKGIYQAPEIAVPSIAEYAETITSTLRRELGHHELPQLILEAGRHLIDESGFLITGVVSRKLLPDGLRAYVLDAGVNLLYTSTWYRFNVELEEDAHGFYEPSILYGPLCMNIDVVDEALMLPPLKVGQRLILSPVGAYNVTQWMQFIQYRPAVVLVRKNGEVDLIRERESLDTVEVSEHLPEDLALTKKKFGKDAA